MKQTRLSPRWIRKMLVIIALVFGLGLWGLYDAVWAYPNKGRRAADFLKFAYLDAVTEGGRRDAPADVHEPEAELRRLSEKARARLPMTKGEEARLRWLEQLSFLGPLKPEDTAIPQALPAYRDLAQRWNNAQGAGPKPLTRYDLPFQWFVAGLGFVGTLLLAGHLVRVRGRVYKWDPETRRLTLPDGATLEPRDVVDYDKRKWDKFIIFLIVRPDHPQCGGKSLRLDLYHHDPLESWVLEMEREAFPENFDKPGESGAEKPADQAAAPSDGDGARADR